MNHRALIAFSLVAGALIGAPLAHAQTLNTRSWVSGLGDDVSPCSRLAPCKTFAGAIAKTAAGGEISVLDAGGFGPVEITKSLTISSDNTSAALVSDGTNGISVNAGTGDIVILRHLSINGAGTGQNGVRYIAGDALVIEHCTLSGFTQAAIDVSVTSGGSLVVEDTSIADAATGVRISGSGKVDVSLDHVSIKKTVVGIDSLIGSTNVSNSIITQNTGYGVFVEGGQVNVERSMLTSNGVAVQAQAGATARLSDNGIYSNLTAFGCDLGKLASAGNNRKASNKGGVPGCGSTATIKIR